MERNRVHPVSGSFYFPLYEGPLPAEEEWWASLKATKKVGDVAPPRHTIRFLLTIVTFFRKQPFKSSCSEIPLPGLDNNVMEFQETKICHIPAAVECAA